MIRDLKLQTEREPRSETPKSKERDPRSEKSKIPGFRNFPATYLDGAKVQALGCGRIRALCGRSAVTISSDLCSEISDPVLFSLPFRSRIAFFSVLQSDRLGHHVIVADLFTKVELGGPDDGESHPFVKSDGPGRLLPDLQPD